LNGLSPSLLSEFEPRLVQLLLNGLSDENPDIIKLAEELIDNCGGKLKELNEQ